MQTLSKVNGHLVKKFTSPPGRSGELENERFRSWDGTVPAFRDEKAALFLTITGRRREFGCTIFEQASTAVVRDDVSKTKQRNHFRRANYVDRRDSVFLR